MPVQRSADLVTDTDTHAHTAMNYLTIEQLRTEVERAAACASVTMPSEDLAPLLDLATREHTQNAQTIAQLQRPIGDTKVELTGDEMRRILNLALQAKMAEARKKPRLRVA